MVERWNRWHREVVESSIGSIQDLSGLDPEQPALAVPALNRGVKLADLF